mmetsp:Transcript_23220/g.64474  ORF Transcript_23220/g.64474 Transcript_23220/m.64474 type:complete len:155 (-) Transcript_23220:55-519(-)
MSVFQQRLAAALAAAAGTVGAAYFVWTPKPCGQSQVKLTLDAAHQEWLKQHTGLGEADSGPVLTRCIEEAKKADPDHVFGVARCVGGKKKKVEVNLTMDDSSMRWLRSMKDKYEITDINKTSRVVVDYNMQEVKQFPSGAPASDGCACGAHIGK